MRRLLKIYFFSLATGFFLFTIPLAAQETQKASYKQEDSVDIDTPQDGDEWILDDEQRQYFMDKALQKSKDLGRYLRLISSKQEIEEDKIYAIKEALNLFVNDSVRVEVSSVNHELKEHYTIRRYLERLRLLPYDKVELVWVKAQMVSRFRKGDDGRYYGVITAQQLFRGFLEDKVAYQDVTEKNIEVVLDRYLVFDDGKKKRRWDVFLSDVSVQQTRIK